MAGVDVKEIVSKVGIDSVIKTREELEKAYLVLQDNIVGYKALNDVMAKSKGMGDFAKSADAAAIAQEKLKQSLLRTQQIEEKIEAQRVKDANAETARQAKKDAIEAQQIAKDNAKIARIKQIESVEVARAQKEAEISAQELANSTQITGAQANEATARGRTNVVTEQTTKAKKLSNLEQEKANQLAKIDRLNLVAQAKEGNAVKGSLEQRQLALARLQKTYSLLTVEERASPFGQRLSKTIPQLNDQVLTLEKNLGKSQRNVGNYGNAFTRAFSGLRTLAMILPGIGIAGLFGVAYEGIAKLVEGLDLFSKKTNQAQATQENLNKSLEGGAYADAVKNVNELRINIDLARKGFIDKEVVLKQYNETIGQTTGKVKSLDAAEIALNKNADAYIQFTLLKAAAQLSLSNAAQEAVKAAQQAQEDEQRLIRQQTDFVIKGDKEGEAVRKILTKDLKRENEQRIKDGQQSQEKQLAIARKFQQQAADIAKKYGFNGLVDVKEEKKKKGVDPAIQARKDAAALIQIQIDANKDIQKVYEDQFKNENFSQQTRLDALRNFTNVSNEIARLEQQKEIKGKKLTADEKLKVDADYNNKKDTANKKSSEETIKILLFEASESERIRLIQGQQTLNVIEKQRNEEITALINNYQKKGDYSEKAQEALDLARLEITRKYNLKELDEQIKQAQKLIEVRKAQGADVTKEQADLSALILKAKDTELQGIDASNKKRLEAEKQNAEAIKEVALGVFDFTRGLTSQIFDTNIANLEKEKEARQSATDLQLENVAESMLSEKEKADQTAIIQAQGEQAQLAIDARIREQKRKQAVADKVFALGQIAINTAVAISKALAQTGVLGAFVIPGIIALGAIQAATVLAQPIPKFAKGGTMAKDGLAEYGHGQELRIDPDGRTSLTKDTPEIGFVRKGTKFVSAPETKRLLAKPDRHDVAGNSWDVSGLIAESKRSSSEIKKAVGKIKVASTQITEKGFSHQSARMGKINNYISRNFSRN